MLVPLLLFCALALSQATAPAAPALEPADAGRPPPLPLPPPPLALAPDAGAPPAEPAAPPKLLHAAAEASLTSFPSGTPSGSQDAFFDLRPILGINLGDPFEVEVGAEFRLRFVDNPPLQGASEIGGVLRRADWDEASDFGQIIRSLRISRPDTVFWIQAGAVRNKTLGLGHLLARYSNQDNPDYHPAGITLAAGYKAIRGELFASDLFGARIFSGELVADVGRIFGSTDWSVERFHLAFSAAHDFGLAGYVAPPVTLVHLDFDTVLYRGSTARIMVLVGLGSRTGDALDPTADIGLLAGLSIDAMLEGGFSIGGKLEVRKQGSGFRQGFIGAGYELARFAAGGWSGPSQAAEQLPDGFSFQGELHLASGGAVSVDLALEHFLFGRTDVDALVSLEVIDHRLIAGARFTGTGLGRLPRYATTTELRVRLFASFYVMGGGGTVFFPQPDGSLVRGIYAGAGAGIDFER